jgi:hypothetical protein
VAKTVPRMCIVRTVERENDPGRPVARRERIVAAATLFGQSGTKNASKRSRPARFQTKIPARAGQRGRRSLVRSFFALRLTLSLIPTAGTASEAGTRPRNGKGHEFAEPGRLVAFLDHPSSRRWEGRPRRRESRRGALGQPRGLKTHLTAGLAPASHLKAAISSFAVAAANPAFFRWQTLLPPAVAREGRFQGPFHAGFRAGPPTEPSSPDSASASVYRTLESLLPDDCRHLWNASASRAVRRLKFGDLKLRSRIIQARNNGNQARLRHAGPEQPRDHAQSVMPGTITAARNRIAAKMNVGAFAVRPPARRGSEGANPLSDCKLGRGRPLQPGGLLDLGDRDRAGAQKAKSPFQNLIKDYRAFAA